MTTRSDHIFVGALAALACVSDLRTRRIPNALTFGAALRAGRFTCHRRRDGRGRSLGGWLLGVVLFFPLFALRGLGAGDVKLLAALGAWLGP